jgi:hypothetical protein
MVVNRQAAINSQNRVRDINWSHFRQEKLEVLFDNSQPSSEMHFSSEVR